MVENQEPLQNLPLEKWSELQNVFQTDWPRGYSGYAALKVQKQWREQGFDHEFNVYCPFGDVKNGMVAVNCLENCNEVIIQSPNDETDKLSDALKRTTVIDWNREVVVPFAPHNVIECLRNTVQDINMHLNVHNPLHTFILEHEFDDVSLPPNVTFGLVTLEHLKLVDSTWPYRYPRSEWLFEKLIKVKCGFGLFSNNNLVSWVFIREVGPN